MSKKQVVYIHGGSSFSNYEDFLENLRTKMIRDLPGQPELNIWSKHLVLDLAADFEVFTPTMPNKQNAKYQEWKIWFERYLNYLNDGVVLIGWSLGGLFLAKYLVENRFPLKINALFLIAAPFSSDGLGKEDCKDFNFDVSLLDNIKSQVDNIYIYHSTDDLIVPYEHALRYQEALPRVKLISFDNYNHFLIENFAELLAEVRRFAV